MEPERIAMPEIFSQPLHSQKPETLEVARQLPPARTIFPVLLFYCCLIAFTYLSACGFPRLLDQIDGQYAGAAREMISNHHWLVPTQNGVPRLRKPPLTYWLEIISFQSLGLNEFAARLPVSLATLGWFIAVGLLAYECSRDKLSSVASSVILATFFGTFQFSHLVMPELLFALLLTCSFWLLIRLAKKNETADRLSPELVFLWIVMALGVLCKGAHGLLLPIGILAVAAWLRPTLRPVFWRIILSKTGWLIFAALVCPWYLAIEHHYPGFILDQFGNEQANMLIGRRWPVDGAHLPLLGFWLEQLAVLFPWTFLIPGAVVASCRFLKSGQRVSSDTLLLSLWFFIYAAAITFANLQDYYLVICLPLVAIWLAWSFTQNLRQLFTSFFPGSLLILSGAVGISLGSQQIAPFFHAQKGALASEMAVTSVATAFADLAGAVSRSLTIGLLLFGSCAVIAGITLIVLRRHRRIALLILPPFVLIICILGLLEEVVLQDYLSSGSIASAINRNSDPNTLIVSKGSISDRTSLYFYLNRKICWLEGDPNQEYVTRRYGKGDDLYLSTSDLRKAWYSPQKVYLILDHASLSSICKGLQLDPNKLRVLITTPTDLVIANGG
ncbi:MAG: phospholipid carrier-dependent glycosyltransferase [Verrucomicrobia bacterium]|nr:phospholipid carrier-dependent glycosyltransferase [Verrucomicrobiota bacterium]